MRARPYRRFVDQGTQGDVHVLPVAHNGIQQRATSPAMHVLRMFVAEHGQAVLPMGDAELVAFDARKGLEGGAGCLAALGAVAIQRIAETVFDTITDITTQAFARKHSTRRYFRNTCTHACFPPTRPERLLKRSSVRWLTCLAQERPQKRYGNPALRRQ